VFDLITVGSFVIDRITSHRAARSKKAVGGPAAYVSLAASKLGARVGVLSKVGEDFREYIEWLQKNEVDLSYMQIVKSHSTTAFALTYNHPEQERRIRMMAEGPRIRPEDIPSSLSARAIHVAPVANELSIEMVRELRKKTALLSFDPQGFLREFDKAGFAALRKMVDLSFLRECDVFKSSAEEIRIMTGHAKLEIAMQEVADRGVEIVLATMGKRGTLALLNQNVHHIPACKARVVKDPTGAGDVFIGAFLAEYIQNREALWCCCVGSAAASFVIEEVGPQRIGEKGEVYERATKIYEKGA
jgi:sugar/nucleoside kinase (ribokinase family)